LLDKGEDRIIVEASGEIPIAMEGRVKLATKCRTARCICLFGGGSIVFALTDLVQERWLLGLASLGMGLFMAYVGLRRVS
jgi:hypothetical protein